MMEYTKGKWKVRKVDTNNAWIYFDDPEPSIEIYSPYDNEALANANLIASAPELYEACKETLAFFNSELADAYLTQGIMLKFPSLSKVALAIAKAEEIDNQP